LTTVTRPALHHVALTVTDIEASTAWYQRVFGIVRMLEEPHNGGWQRLLADHDWQLVIVLHHHDVNGGERFSERRTGLDHFGMSVPTRVELEAWQAHLEEMGVVRAAAADRPCTQSPIAETRMGQSWSSGIPTTSSSRCIPHRIRDRAFADTRKEQRNENSPPTVCNPPR
jgi:catechol 2,3-dioxygenase-like lactoylglutathione lyase family enzyme